MKEESITIYFDGATVRKKNKRISFHEKAESTMIKFSMVDPEAEIPGCYHKCHRGKVRETFIKLSNEGMTLLVHSWLEYKRRNHKQNKTTK